MKTLFTVIGLFVAVTLQAANPAFQDFFGTNGIIIRTNGAAGNQKVQVDGGRLQPASANLTNWSAISTNRLPPFTTLLAGSNTSLTLGSTNGTNFWMVDSSGSGGGGGSAVAGFYYGNQTPIAIAPTYPNGSTVDFIGAVTNGVATNSSGGFSIVESGYYLLNGGATFQLYSNASANLLFRTNGVSDTRVISFVEPTRAPSVSDNYLLTVSSVLYLTAGDSVTLHYSVNSTNNYYYSWFNITKVGGSGSSSGGSATNAVDGILTNGVYVLQTGATNINFLGATGMVVGGTVVIGGFSGSGGSGDATNILSGNTVFVDQRNGNDTTATRTNFAKPAATIAKANAISLYGDTIIIRPGTYDEASLTTNGRNYILQGASVRYTGAATRGLIDDFWGPITNSVTGSGQIWMDGANGNDVAAVVSSNALTRILIDGPEVLGLSISGQQPAIKMDGGTVRVRSPRIEGSQYGLTDDDVYGIWFSGGDLVVDALEILGEKHGIYVTGTGWGTNFILGQVQYDKLVVNAGFIAGHYEAPIMMGSANVFTNGNEPIISIQANVVRGRGNPQGGIVVNSGHLNFSANWLGQTNVNSPVWSHGESPIVMFGGRLTARVGVVAGLGGLVSIRGGLFDISVQRFEDLGSTVYPNGIWITNAQGIIRDFSVIKTNGPALNYGGTNLTIADAFFSMPLNSATNSAIAVRGSGLVIRDTTIEAPALAPAITADSAQLVTVEGLVKINRTNSPNITLGGLHELNGGLRHLGSGGLTLSSGFTNQSGFTDVDFFTIRQGGTAQDSWNVQGLSTNESTHRFKGPVFKEFKSITPDSAGIGVADASLGDWFTNNAIVNTNILVNNISVDQSVELYLTSVPGVTVTLSQYGVAQYIGINTNGGSVPAIGTNGTTKVIVTRYSATGTNIQVFPPQFSVAWTGAATNFVTGVITPPTTFTGTNYAGVLATNRLLFTDANTNIYGLTIGSGLVSAGGTLTATSGTGGSDIVTNITVSSTNRILLDFAAANVFKLTVMTNVYYDFTNQALLTRRGLAYFKTMSNGPPCLVLSARVAGGLLQFPTNNTAQFDTNLNALSLLELESGFETTNILAYWPLDFHPRTSSTNTWSTGGGSFSATAVTFDGSNDYLNRGADITTDSKVGLVSFWFKASAGLGGHVMGNASQVFTIQVAASLLIDAYTDPSLGDQAMRLVVNTDYRDDAWHHVMASWDLTDTMKRFVYVDGADVTAATVYDNQTIEYSTGDWTIGSRGDAFGKFNGCLTEVLFKNAYLDLSVSGNRDLFYNAGEPADPGATGSSSELYIHTWSGSYNDGTGGAFSLTGALGACTAP